MLLQFKQGVIKSRHTLINKCFETRLKMSGQHGGFYRTGVCGRTPALTLLSLLFTRMIEDFGQRGDNMADRRQLLVEMSKC